MEVSGFLVSWMLDLDNGFRRDLGYRIEIG